MNFVHNAHSLNCAKAAFEFATQAANARDPQKVRWYTDACTLYIRKLTDSTGSTYVKGAGKYRGCRYWTPAARNVIATRSKTKLHGEHSIDAKLVSQEFITLVSCGMSEAEAVMWFPTVLLVVVMTHEEAHASGVNLKHNMTFAELLEAPFKKYPAELAARIMDLK